MQGLRHFGTQGRVVLAGAQVFGQHDDGKRGLVAQAANQRDFHHGVHIDQVFDGRGRHVLAFAGFKQFFHAPGNLELPVRGDHAQIAGVEKAVGGEGLGVQVWALVVAHQLAGGLDQNLALGADARLHSGVGNADIARLAEFGRGGVRVGKVFGHAQAFEQLQAQAAVPADQVGRQGRRAAEGQNRLVQAQVGQDLLGYDAFDDGDAQEQRQFLLRHLGEHGLLELEPQARHRYKDGGPGALQVGGKSI